MGELAEFGWLVRRLISAVDYRQFFPQVPRDLHTQMQGIDAAWLWNKLPDAIQHMCFDYLTAQEWALSHGVCRFGCVGTHVAERGRIAKRRKRCSYPYFKLLSMYLGIGHSNLIVRRAIRTACIRTSLQSHFEYLRCVHVLDSAVRFSKNVQQVHDMVKQLDLVPDFMKVQRVWRSVVVNASEC